MNGRKVFRDYAIQEHNKEAKEFVKIENDFYNNDTLITKDNNGQEERTTINYKDLVHWIIKNK
jgi:pectin methylesterase-like acyl-CoA thioesterase